MFAAYTPYIYGGIVGSGLTYFNLTYGFGRKKNNGYDVARQELQEQARIASARTLGYIEKDKAIIRDRGFAAIDAAFMKERINIALLPKWEIKLLGDIYIIRRPLRDDWKIAWIMTEKDSENIDKEIEEMMVGTKYELNMPRLAQATKIINSRITTDIEDFIENKETVNIYKTVSETPNKPNTSCNICDKCT